jgi:hypothetical protein
MQSYTIQTESQGSVDVTVDKIGIDYWTVSVMKSDPLRLLTTMGTVFFTRDVKFTLAQVLPE